MLSAVSSPVEALLGWRRLIAPWWHSGTLVTAFDGAAAPGELQAALPAPRTCTSIGEVVPSSDPMPAVDRYVSEAALVRDFVAAMRSADGPFCAEKIGAEFDYRDGRTDVVSLSSDGELIAFEAKLTQWRVALHQAYRNTSYAHRSYVVLPAPVAERVISHRSEFERRRVGLCAVNSEGCIAILHAAPRIDPLMPWVSNRAVAYVTSQAIRSSENRA